MQRRISNNPSKRTRVDALVTTAIHTGSTHIQACKLLTVDEVCDLLRIGRTQFYRLAKSKLLGTVKIGRSVRVPVTALERYVATLEGVTNV